MKTCLDNVSPDLFAVGEYWTGNADVLEDRLHRFEGTVRQLNLRGLATV